MILIGNGRLITRDSRNSYYEDGAVAVEGSLIKEAGPYSKLRERYPEAEYIDAGGGLIMPGLINAHHHIYSAMARGLSIPGNPPQNFLEILQGTWWNIDRRLTLENVFYSALTTYMDCIKNGVTSVIDHHAGYGAVAGSLSEIARAAGILSVRTCLAYEISDRDGKGRRNEALKETMEFLALVKEKDSPLLRGMVGLHASFTVSDETLALCKKENQNKAGYHIHAAEGAYDESHCQATYGKSVVKRLAGQEILGPDTIAAHCIHISEEDMGILEATGTMVVHNPESNMGNGVGCPDTIRMLKKGITVGLGTDGYTSDMLESLKVANILQKHRRGMPDLGFSEANRMLYENNAAIASRIFGRTIGVLEAGAPADIIILDYEPYTPMNQENIDGHIMFGINGAMTDTAMIHGRLVMRNRKLLTVEEAEIRKESRISARRLWDRLTGR